jgi:hypothetical protein
MNKKLFTFKHEPTNKNQSTHINIDLVQDLTTKLWYLVVNDQPYSTIKNIDRIEIFGEYKSKQIKQDIRINE